MRSTSESINSNGQIVGASQSGCDRFTEAFLWENGGPMVDLNSLISAGPDFLLTGAFWINDRGEITGRGVPPGCDDVDVCGHAFLLLPCDAGHPGISGCNYEAIEAVAPANQVRQPAMNTVQAASTAKRIGRGARVRYPYHSN